LIQREAASFIDALEEVQRGDRDGIVMTIDALGNEPELLRPHSLLSQLVKGV
jgi:hypothetical protein